jgi:Flp pilus assembly protein TadG
MLPVFCTKRPLRGRFWKDTGATSAIEFALVSPVLFLLMFGIITFGVQYSTRVALTYAASEGGRAAVAGLTDAERTSLARAAIQSTLVALSPLVNAANATVSINLSSQSGGENIGISIVYAQTDFATMPFMPDLSNLSPVTVNYYVTDPSS